MSANPQMGNRDINNKEPWPEKLGRAFSWEYLWKVRLWKFRERLYSRSLSRLLNLELIFQPSDGLLILQEIFLTSLSGPSLKGGKQKSASDTAADDPEDRSASKPPRLIFWTWKFSCVSFNSFLTMSTDGKRFPPALHSSQMFVLNFKLTSNCKSWNDITQQPHYGWPLSQRSQQSSC